MEQISIKIFNTDTKPIFTFLNWSMFQGVNRLFVLLFENEEDGKVHTGYYIPKVEIKEYNVL